MQKNDKYKELERYDKRIKNLELKDYIYSESKVGSDQVDLINKPIYKIYEKKLSEYINFNDVVLEIGAGIGLHTFSILKECKHLISTDISPESINILKAKFLENINFTAEIADIENLPYKDNSFDVVCCAGSLSYGNNFIVFTEISRVLKKNGYFIMVDSLNENPIYKLNRFLHYVRGKRTLSTLKNMPNLKLFKIYKKKFKIEYLSFHGSIVWLVPLLRIFFKEDNISKIIHKFDNLTNIKRSAFKYISVLKKNK